MAPLVSTKGIVVGVGEQVTQDLRKLANDHGLPILEAHDADFIIKEIQCLCLSVIIVQVTQLSIEILRLIRMITTSPQPVHLIVVATSHNDEIERAVLIAGASFYVPGTEKNLVNQALVAMTTQTNDT